MLQCKKKNTVATLFGAKHEQNNLSKTFDEGTSTKKNLGHNSSSGTTASKINQCVGLY